MGAIHQLAAMYHYGPGWELYWEHDHVQGGDGSGHGEVVVRVRPKVAKPADSYELPVRGHEVCRLGWPHHVHRPAEPLHPDLMAMIGESLVVALREAHLAGRQSAMKDLRQLIGAEAVGVRR